MTPPHRGRRRTAFTLVEILVVIALIGVLAGILLVAVGGATDAARTLKTKATMESLSAAIDSFVLKHKALPGIVPVTALHNGESDGAWMTNTQNILLHLMGGARVSPVGMNDDAVLNPTMEVEYNRFKDSALEEDGVKPLTFTLDDEPHGIRYKVAVRTPRIGEGPWINGQQFSPYLSPKEHELLEQWPWGYSGPELPNGEGGRAIVAGFTALPDLIDAWGQPIIVFRRERDSGPILLADDTDTRLPQFRLNGIDRYLAARNLGRQQEPQRCDINEPVRGSRIGDDNELHEREYWLYLLLSHPAMRWEWEDSNTPVDCIGTGRAGYAMLSAGPDGIFFSRYDGPRTDDDGVPIAPNAFPADSEDPAFGKDHERLKEFDDVIMYGGS